MSLPPSLAIHAAAQGGAFTTAQALSAGYDEREISALLRTRRWTRLRRGVFAESTLISDDDAKLARLALRALELRTTRRFVASHETAAVLHNLTLLRPDTDLIHVTRPSRGGGRVEAGVRWHSGALPGDHVTRRVDLDCTTVARTVVDIARETDFRNGLVVAESALNRKLVTLEELRRVHQFCSDWPGARTAGRVVSFASPLSESPGETLSRMAFADQGLPDPKQQRYIYDALGRQTTMPAVDSPARSAAPADSTIGDISLGYFDDDLPRSVTQTVAGTSTSTVFTLDSSGRRA